MIWKLARSGLWRKRRELMILFSGLIVSIGVFSMFLTMSLNEEFITQNSVINNIQLVFLVGTVMLMVITFFYLSYANLFLLSLRKKDFGLYELIGAKKKQIKQLFLLETLIITGSALILGLLLGTGFSWLVSELLMAQLDSEFAEFTVFYLPAAGWTIVYFIGASLLLAFKNTNILGKTSIIQLLKSDKQQDVLPPKRKTGILSVLAGLICLFTGYLSLYFMEQLRFIGLFTAPVATTLGTYLLYVSLLPPAIRKWKANKRANAKGIRSFTLAQLSFRLHDLKWMLATIAMLIALSAGAIAGGFAFLDNAFTSIDEERLYDVTLYNHGAAEEEILDEVPLDEQLTYRFKMDDYFIYYPHEELMANPPLIIDWITGDIKRPEVMPTDLPLNEYDEQILTEDWMTALDTINPAFTGTRTTNIVPLSEYEGAPGQEISVFVASTDDFGAYLDEWRALDQLQLRTAEEISDSFDPVYDSLSSKYANFESNYAFASGTFFMGFFLGFAFLTMLASILMLKILSGAASDRLRYESLRKLGVRRKLLAASLSKEILLIFLFPALLGLLHVVVGMRMFSFILSDPYHRLSVSILIFLVIYGGYYFLTVYLYKKIVLPKG